MDRARSSRDRGILQTSRCVLLWVRCRRGMFSAASLTIATINNTQILTGELIWENIGTAKVRSNIADGERPRMPKGKVEFGVTVETWGILAKCWGREAEERITISDVLNFLQDT